jgi:hypothetical protein
VDGFVRSVTRWACQRQSWPRAWAPRTRRSPSSKQPNAQEGLASPPLRAPPTRSDATLSTPSHPAFGRQAQIRAQAEHVLARDFASVANSMRLQDHGVTGDAARDAREELAKISTERGLWSVVD